MYDPDPRAELGGVGEAEQLSSCIQAEPVTRPEKPKQNLSVGGQLEVTDASTDFLSAAMLPLPSHPKPSLSICLEAL